MHQLLQMAWRNLWRVRRRTLVGVGAMAIALLAMMLYTSFMEGMLIGMEEDILEVDVGDLQVFAPGFRDRPALYATIAETDAVCSSLRAEGFAVAPRWQGGALVAAGEASAGGQLVGVDLDWDRSASALAERVAEGRWLSSDQRDGVVVGRRLADLLDVEVGSELVMLSQAIDGSLANDLFYVRGVLGSISEGTDRASVFVAREAWADFFGTSWSGAGGVAGAHQLIVRRPRDGRLADLEAAAGRVGELAAGLDVQTWRQLQPTVASILDTTRAMLAVAILVIYTAVAILVLNAMLMATFERIREFGVLKAIGLAPRHVFSLIAIEGVLQFALACLVALLLSVPGLWWVTQRGIDMGVLSGASASGITFDPVQRGAISSLTFVAPLGLMFLVVLAAIAYPAWRAARIEPVEAMRAQ